MKCTYCGSTRTIDTNGGTRCANCCAGSTAQHTPGPWARERRNDGHYINGVIHVPDFYEGHEADARLITAAPELLRVAEAAREWERYATEPQMRTDGARALTMNEIIQRRRDARAGLIAALAALREVL